MESFNEAAINQMENKTTKSTEKTVKNACYFLYALNGFQYEGQEEKHIGLYLNPGNLEFTRARSENIYVDKSELIHYTNDRVNKEMRFMYISRPRRFGKSMAANMLTAYYSRGCDSAGCAEISV